MNIKNICIRYVETEESYGFDAKAEIVGYII